MIVGAAHTDGVVAQLKQNGASYVVISPESFRRDTLSGGISIAAFDRKANAKSVDPDGLPGAILDGRAGHLPPPVLETTWLERKANIYQATDIISRAFAAGGNPPFNDQNDAIGQLDGITIDPTSYRPFTLHNGKQALLFKISVQVGDSPDDKKDIWVAASDGQPPKPPIDPSLVITPEPPEDNDPVEKLLQDDIEDEREAERSQKADGQDPVESEHPTSDAKELIALTDKTTATFADNPETAQRNMEAAG